MTKKKDHIHSDINHSIEVLQDESKCEFIICSDVSMTPSAKFADVLLPAPSFLEEDNIADPWRAGHYLLHNRQIIRPLFGCRNEYDCPPAILISRTGIPHAAPWEDFMRP